MEAYFRKADSAEHERVLKYENIAFRNKISKYAVYCFLLWLFPIVFIFILSFTMDSVVNGASASDSTTKAIIATGVFTALFGGIFLLLFWGKKKIIEAIRNRNYEICYCPIIDREHIRVRSYERYYVTVILPDHQKREISVGHRIYEYLREQKECIVIKTNEDIEEALFDTYDLCPEND